MSPKPSAVPPSSYRLGDMLGSGLYGIVREAIHVKTAKCYACKIMEKELMKGWRWTVRNEIAVLKRVSGENPNIVTLHDHFESVQNVYLCLDLCTGGRLFDQTAMRPYYEADAAALVRTLFTAVKYIHAAGVIHRNLNPKSILFRTPAEERDIVIAGFGFSRFIKEDESIMEGWSDGMYPGCTAPEVFLKKGHSKPVDVWAMGTITYFLLAGYTPFHRDTPKEQVKAIIAGDYEFEPKEHWTGVSDTARDFMKACLTIDPAGRLSAAEALEHKWLASTTPHFVPEPSSQSGDLADLLLHGNMQVDLPPSSSPAEPQISSDELACIDAAADPGHRRLLEAGQLFQEKNLPDHIAADLKALPWISNKYESASAPLPPRLVIYADSMIRYVNSPRELAEEEKNGSQENRKAFEPPPHIASAFLIESTDYAQREVETASTERLRVTDFNGRQLYLPLELCKSWPDLCLFLSLFFRGDKRRHFITSRNFGLRVPTEMGLLSSDTWDLWVARFTEDVGKLPVTLDLYAIMNDDSDSCPHCKIHSPVKQPLPDNQQQCLACQSTFLESYEEPCDDLIQVVSNAAKLSPSPQNTPGNFDFVSTYSEPELSEIVPQPSVSNAHVSSAAQISGMSVPMHVQVIRRRKLVQQDLEDTQRTPISTDQATSSAPPHTPQTASHCWKLLHVLYMYVMFGLPDRYCRDVAQSQSLGSNDNRARRTYGVWVDEWTQIGSAAGVLFSVLFTILQISSASYDPVVRTVVQLSIVCLFFGAIYAFILRMMFRKLGNEPEGLGWLRQATSRAARHAFWNPWIMLSMPLAWIIWGVLYFACFILAFLWRSGATNEADANSKLSPNQEYGPRAITTLLFLVGAIYCLVIIVTVREIGTARNPYVALRV